jgi:tetratricopeptide (TPR) repeat protein
MNTHHRRRIEQCLDQRGTEQLREYIDGVLREEPDNCEFLELAAECANGASQCELELSFRMRAFTTSPNFAALRRLADVLGRTGHWEMAAEAWLNVARARPLDDQAFAEAAVALGRLDRPALAAAAWECACRIQPDNASYAAEHAKALARSNARSPQGIAAKGR